MNDQVVRMLSMENLMERLKENLGGKLNGKLIENSAMENPKITMHQ